jgi:hypothetical protein
MNKNYVMALCLVLFTANVFGKTIDINNKSPRYWLDVRAESKKKWGGTRECAAPIWIPEPLAPGKSYTEATRDKDCVFESIRVIAYPDANKSKKVLDVMIPETYLKGGNITLTVTKDKYTVDSDAPLSQADVREGLSSHEKSWDFTQRPD